MKRDFLMSLTRKTRIFVFLVLTLWIAVILQFAVERIFLKKGNISEAFSELHMKENIGNVTVTAVYDDSYLSEYDKKQLLYYIAEQIGLKVDVEPSVFYANNRCEVWYEKQAVRADSLLKIISTSEEGLDKHYVYVSLTIQEETAKSIAIYQERICTCLKELGAEDISVTLELSGKQVGEIPLGKKD